MADHPIPPSPPSPRSSLAALLLIPLAVLAALVVLEPARPARAEGAPFQPHLWSAVSALDALAAARACAADPGCSGFEAPTGIVQDPATGQPLLSVHCKAAMDVGPLHDWAAADPAIHLDEKLVHIGDKTGFEVDVGMDLLDVGAWTGLRAALDTIGTDAFVSLHAVAALQDGVHADVAAAPGQVAACQGDVTCLQDLRRAEPWLDPFSSVGAIQIEVPHSGAAGEHEAIAADLAGLSWAEPAMIFDVEHTQGGARMVRAVGRMPILRIEGLGAFLGGKPWTARSRPLTEDELSMVRLKLDVAEAAADLSACAGDASCHWAVGQEHQAVVSPGGRLGVMLLGQAPDIEGLNGLEYPGWTLAPDDYTADGAAGLVAFSPLRDLALGRWGLLEALIVDVNRDPEIVSLPVDDWGDLWTASDYPIGWEPPDWGDDDTWEPGQPPEPPPCDAPPPPRWEMQAVTWILPHREDPSTCPASYQAAFLGPLASGAKPEVVSLPSPPPSGTAHLVQTSMPSYAFFFDYLHCRELIANSPGSLVAWSPEYEYCGELYAGLAGLAPSFPYPELYPDLYALAAGVALNGPPGVQNDIFGGGVGEDFDVSWWDASDIDPVLRTGHLDQPAPALLPEAKLHAFDDWGASVDASVMLDERTLALTGYVYVDDFELPMDYVMETTTFSEIVFVPAWSWEFTATWSIPGWELLALTVKPGDFDSGFDLDGQVTVSAAGQAEGLDEGSLASHAEAVVEALVTETIADRIGPAGPALDLFFFDYLFETNGLLADSVSNSGELVQATDPCGNTTVEWVATGEREILAIDRVEGDETWEEYTMTEASFPLPNGTCLNPGSSLGFAVVLEAEVPGYPPASGPTLYPTLPGFREIELDGATAGSIWQALGMDTVDPSIVYLSGTGPAQRSAPLEMNAVQDFVAELLGGYAAWAFTPSQTTFDCATPASDGYDVCMPLAEVPPPPEDDTCTDPATDDDCACSGNVPDYCACREQVFLDECAAGMEPAWIVDDAVDTGLPMLWPVFPLPIVPGTYQCGSIQGVSIDAVSVQSGPDHLVGLPSGEGTVCPSQEPGAPGPRFELDPEIGEVVAVLPHCAVATVQATANVNLATFAYTMPPGVPSSCPGGIQGMAGAFPADRSAMRPTESPGSGPLWEGQDITYAADLELVFEVDIGLEMEFRVPFRFQGVDIDGGQLVGWDSMADWFVPMMEQVPIEELAEVFEDSGDPGPARTGVALSIGVANRDLVAGAGTLYLGPAGFPYECPQAECNDIPKPAFCDGPWALSKGNSVPMPQCVVDSFSGELDPVVEAVQAAAGALALEFELPNIAEVDFEAAALVPGPSLLGMQPDLATALYTFVPLPALVPLSFLDEVDQSQGAFMAVWPYEINTMVGAYQHLFDHLGVQQIGWPTREAVWLAMLDAAGCDTLADPTGGVGDCWDDVLVELAGPGARDESYPALWLFPPDPSVFDPADADPVWSGATWKPGRLPQPP